MEGESGTVALSGAPSEPLARVMDRPGDRWIVSPLFDLAFFANLGWLLALLPGFVSAEGTPHIEFWQLYFLTTPHRWLTLILVATDADRREGRTWLFVLLALALFAFVWGMRLFTGAFLCLLLVDYVWNGWHFASQHAGVLRIYSRKASGGWPLLERWGMRIFVFYVIARTAGWSTGWLEAIPQGMESIRLIDFAMLSLPVCLFVLEVTNGLLGHPGKAAYLCSVLGLYSALLLALGAHHTLLVLALTAASATFHAVEYLAIVSHYAWRQSTKSGSGLFGTFARSWVSFLAAFMVLLGLAAWLLHSVELWLGMNLWAALVHYAYDGMIWKLRRPATAQALGVGTP